MNVYRRTGDMVEVLARDTAMAASLCLQCGCDVETLRRAQIHGNCAFASDARRGCLQKSPGFSNGTFVAAARAAFIVSRDSEDENRRLFVPSKNNLGPDRDGLAFRIETREVAEGIIAPAVSWDSEPVTHTADEILSAMSGGGDRHAAKEDARILLQEVLAQGPMSVADLEAEARAAGILGERQRLSYNKAVRVAADSLAVVRKREGFGRGATYLWSLPDAPSVPTGAMLAHVCPISKQGTHGTHEESHEGRGDL